MSVKESDFVAHKLELLKKRTTRLEELLELEAPPQILIANEIRLILEAGIGYCELEVLGPLSESMQRMLREIGFSPVKS